MADQDILHLRVHKIIRETADAFTFILDHSNQNLSYQAGQFITLLIKNGRNITRRSYSLCTTPGIDPYIAITVKRKTNGSVSRYLIDHIKEGDMLDALAPSGRFTINAKASNQRDILLLAAGSGIVPVFSLLKKILLEEPRSRVILLYSNSHAKSIIYQKAIQELSVKYADRFQCIHIISDPHNNIPNVITGHLNNQLLGELILQTLHFDPALALFLLCGPPAYMRMVQLTLAFMGFEDQQVKKENFVVPEEIPVAYLPHDNKSHAVLITFHQQRYNLTVLPHQTILDAALVHHIPLPYSCKGGVCSTCTAKCRRGNIVMSRNEVLTDEDLKAGLILTCTGYIIGNEMAEISFE